MNFFLVDEEMELAKTERSKNSGWGGTHVHLTQAFIHDLVKHLWQIF